jgi:hypothetical protein
MMDIVKRLRLIRGPNSTCTFAADTPVNPDGPEAADTIEALCEALQATEQVVSRYAQYLDGISYHELEMHPYIPSVEQARDDARAALAKAGVL